MHSVVNNVRCCSCSGMHSHILPHAISNVHMHGGIECMQIQPHSCTFDYVMHIFTLHSSLSMCMQREQKYATSCMHANYGIILQIVMFNIF